MMEVFLNDGDIHSKTAKGCFHLEETEEEIAKKFPELRDRAKPVNFGVVYGIGGRSLAIDINSGLDDPKEFLTSEDGENLINGFLQTYPRVKSYISFLHDRAESEGAVKTITGRSRHLPEAMLNPKHMKSPFARQSAYIKKSKAMRQAQNSAVQGSAADVMAITMRNIRNHFMKNGGWFTTMQMILQVHDELSFLFREGYEEDYQEEVVDLMEGCVTLTVPLKVDGSQGGNWWECK